MAILPPPGASETIRLWADHAPPTTIEDVGEEVAYPVRAGVAAGGTFLRNISDPTLTVVPPPAGKANGHGVLIAPGGGWTINAWTHEGVDVARWLAGAGYTTFLLKYRVQRSGSDQAKFEARMASSDGALAAKLPTARLPRAIGELIQTPAYLQARDAAADDGRRAVELVRDQADRFGVDPDTLGMIGFSAGAFLAVDVALDPRGGRPLAWIAPIYGGETRGTPVPPDAPPLFTAVAQDDVLWKIVEGLHREWSDADRSSELHVFARGAHGFGMVRQGLPSDRWTDLFLAWLADR